MNSRPYSHPTTSLKDHTYHIVEKAVLCIAAFWPTRLPQRVKTGIPLEHPHVRFHRVRTLSQFIATKSPYRPPAGGHPWWGPAADRYPGSAHKPLG
jgi:hypothetical protein